MDTLQPLLRAGAKTGNPRTIVHQRSIEQGNSDILDCNPSGERAVNRIEVILALGLIAIGLVLVFDALSSPL